MHEDRLHRFDRRSERKGSKLTQDSEKVGTVGTSTWESAGTVAWKLEGHVHSLRRVAAHGGEVRRFDLSEPELLIDQVLGVERGAVCNEDVEEGAVEGLQEE